MTITTFRMLIPATSPGNAGMAGRRYQCGKLSAKSTLMADREWWNKVEELYHAARELDAEQRAGFLDQACDSDPSLRV